MGRLTTVLATIATSLWGTAVMAAYVPPPDQVPPRTRGGTAGRRTTCEVNAITPLAPLNYLGKTTQSHPTFYWSKTGQGNVPLEFSLMEYLPHTQQLVVLHRTRLSSQGNIDRFQLPPTWQGLAVGKIYAWQVVALCGNPSANPYLRASVQRVDMVSKNTTNLEEKIKQLALQGIWYDALTLAMTSGNRQLGLTLLQNLAQAEEKREPSDMAQEYRHSFLLQSVHP
ncbi:MAG: DUF928 domain-containing protein [Pseudanabaenaceae cyanobacterium SKYGB_i_bin29]|nr:DUF928 domain-containing protein [Pseudanabaenaceae cyanobacterium SKYG29]MDW8421951.1 DUF928 domain-containing protein [Pseudanabaenaceae cyanobacterium SKYGB_i_bin29]